MPAQLRSRLPGPALFLALCVAPGAAMAADFFDELGAGLESIGTAITDTVKEGVQNSNALDNPTVSGRYVVPGTAGTVTCFKGATSGYILPPGATSPSAPGTRLTMLNCDKLATKYGGQTGKTAAAGTATKSAKSDVIWPGEPPAVEPNADHPCYGMDWKARDGAPDIGKCLADYQRKKYRYDDEIDASKKAVLDKMAADRANTARQQQQILENSNKTFQDLQARIARDAAAVQAHNAAAIAAERAKEKAGQ